MDKATPTLRQRCDTALQSLPDAPYRAMLAALFDEMLAEVERLAAQAAPTEQADLRQLMGMNEAEIDAELLAAGISPDDAVKRADRAIKGALATVRAERRAIEYGDIVHKQVVAMRAAVVAAKLESPEVGIQWIANTLFGPGHYPDIEAARELGGAQALFDKEMAEHEAFRAAHPAPVADQPSQAPVVQAVQTEVRFKYESMKPIDGYDAIYAEYATTFGRYPDDFMSKVVRQTKEDLFMWWGAHREKIRAGLVLLAAQEDASSGATTQAIPFSKDSWQHAVDNQLVAFGRTSQEFANPHEALAWLAIMNMELGQSNAGATTQAVRFMTSDDCQEHIGRTWLTHEEDAAIAAFCAVNAGRTIPADGKIGGV